MLAGKFRVIEIKRTRVCLLFSDADFREIVDQYFRFDLQLARQLINSNLIRVRHSLRLFFLSVLVFLTAVLQVFCCVRAGLIFRFASGFR